MAQVKRKIIKCPICHDELLGDISDIEDPEERFYKLKEFCLILQEICWRESKIETLRNIRNVFKKSEEDRI